MKLLVYEASKDWTTIIGFIVAIIFLNSAADVADLIFLNYIPTKTRTKILQRLDGFSIILIRDIPLLIINTLINNLCLKYLAKK